MIDLMRYLDNGHLMKQMNRKQSEYVGSVWYSLSRRLQDAVWLSNVFDCDREIVCGILLGIGYSLPVYGEHGVTFLKMLDPDYSRIGYAQDIIRMLLAGIETEKTENICTGIVHVFAREITTSEEQIADMVNYCYGYTERMSSTGLCNMMAITYMKKIIEKSEEMGRIVTLKFPDRPDLELRDRYEFQPEKARYNLARFYTYCLMHYETEVPELFKRGLEGKSVQEILARYLSTRGEIDIEARFYNMEKEKQKSGRPDSIEPGITGTKQKKKPENLLVTTLQTKVKGTKEETLAYITKTFESRRECRDTDFVVLPEMFACPYENEKFPVYAEPEGGPMWQFCSDLAKKYGVYLLAGTVPELVVSKDEENGGGIDGESSVQCQSGKSGSGGDMLDKDGEASVQCQSEKRGIGKVMLDQNGESLACCQNGKIYNTAYVFDREGRQIAKYRKMHLFDIDIKGGQYFKESDTLSAGDEVVVFDTEWGKMGICICYDIRFPELMRIMVDDGAKVIFCPAAFNTTTGPKHWELLFRTRAVDNQVFTVGVSPARDEAAFYQAYGHSIVCDPWGEILLKLDEGARIGAVELDFSELERARKELPLLKHRRPEIYAKYKNEA